MASAAISAGLGLASGIAGFFGDKKKNKLAKKQLKLQKQLTDRQIEISKYIEQYAKQAANMNGDITDPYGGTVRFNPDTGKYEYSLNPMEKGIQDASYSQELDRNTKDQDIRRRGLTDFERLRGRSSDQADVALNDILAFKRGVNRVDPSAVAGQLRADRTRQINAGYDDAERAAQTLQLRTGSSAVGAALNDLARNRVRAQAEIGNPELEGLQFSEGINNDRLAQLFGAYDKFGGEARGFYDAAFTPSNYNIDAYNRLTDRMKFDLSKLDLAMGGSGQAASTIGNAQRNQLGADAAFMQNRVNSPLSKALSGLGDFVGSGGLSKLFPGIG